MNTNISTNTTNISELYEQVRQAGLSTDSIVLSNFHNPVEETEAEVQRTQLSRF